MKKMIGMIAAGVMILSLAACSSDGKGGAESTSAETNMSPVVVTTAADTQQGAGAADGQAAGSKENGAPDIETESESAEGAEKETEEETSESAEAETSAAPEAGTGQSVVTTPAADGLTLAERPGVYRLQYDAALFRLTEADGTDSYEYTGEQAFPVYVAVQVLPDTPAQQLADGLVLQSGRDDVTAEETNFGADSIPVKNIYIETEADGLTQIQLYYVIEKGTGSILIEAGSYVGAEEIVDSSIETILGTFELAQ